MTTLFYEALYCREVSADNNYSDIQADSAYFGNILVHIPDYRFESVKCIIEKCIIEAFDCSRDDNNV